MISSLCRNVTVLTALALLTVPCRAQRVGFRLQFVGAELLGYYADNLSVLQRMDTLLKSMDRERCSGIDSIVLSSGYLLGDVGPYLKAGTARERIESVRTYLVRRTEHYGYDPLTVTKRLVRYPEYGSDPRELTCVNVEMFLKERSDAVSIPGTQVPVQTMTVRGGSPYRHRQREYQGGHGIRTSPVLALKTDLVLWSGVTPGFEVMTFLPNLAVEVYLGNRWSIEGSIAYSHWNGLRDDRFYALDTYGIEPRLWFRSNHLFRGFYAGLSGRYGSFDRRPVLPGFEDNAGYTGTFFTAGISIGYVLPLSRHWVAELALTGGCRMEKIKAYRIEGAENYYNESFLRNRLVPGLQLNLTYRINRRRQAGAGRKESMRL